MVIITGNQLESDTVIEENLPQSLQWEPQPPRKAYWYGSRATYRSQLHIARPGARDRVATRGDVGAQDDALSDKASIFKTSAIL
ncbi:hypothetical protein DL766_010293 [Monosporascus sp. MC13-8B]|uniref:Uncharacterized protein n=1 Tax=Monosporascus cannonballus TaxID=155416 RepID=A0ABY0HHR3_9PEZI|nr:hypothetical protein DL762_001781 [Monosporascus cannonballus]RYO93785.1 hypothetical protein DL763_004270 [Monosporascus cannonballus]RYP02550.1 hypothetical protein DL766_010293 [Monosporascus sp. MC13-8B]